jgi:Pilin (bacterial filament)
MFSMKKYVTALTAALFVMLGSAAHAACTNDGLPAAVRANAISEALTFASASRTAYADYFQNYGVPPGSNATAGVASPTELASGSCWTRSANVNTDGVRV